MRAHRRDGVAGFATLLAAAGIVGICPRGWAGQELSDAVAAPAAPFAFYGQSTYTEQGTDGFHSPYSGPQSLSPHIARETVDVTLYLGTHLWRGGELWLNPEVDQGYGLDEQILEGYYEAAVIRALTVTFDTQWVQNPGYNRDRGPVAVYALRLHVGW